MYMCINIYVYIYIYNIYMFCIYCIQSLWIGNQGKPRKPASINQDVGHCPHPLCLIVSPHFPFFSSTLSHHFASLLSIPIIFHEYRYSVLLNPSWFVVIPRKKSPHFDSLNPCIYSSWHVIMIQLPFIFFRNNMDSPIFRFRRRVLAEKNPAVFAQDIEDSLDEFFTNRLTLRLMISHIQALNANKNVNSDGEAPPPKIFTAATAGLEHHYRYLTI